MSPEDFRVYLFHPEDIWKIAYPVISEDDLKMAVETLPDIGIGAVERNTQIKKLDGEIAALEKTVGEELKKL